MVSTYSGECTPKQNEQPHEEWITFCKKKEMREQIEFRQTSFALEMKAFSCNGFQQDLSPRSQGRAVPLALVIGNGNASFTNDRPCIPCRRRRGDIEFFIGPKTAAAELIASNAIYYRGLLGRRGRFDWRGQLSWRVASVEGVAPLRRVS